MPHGPVNVLQAAVDVVGRANVQALLEIGVPRLRQIRHRQRALEHFLLEVVAQHDVHRISELIGIHADEAALHANEMAVQVLLAPLLAAHLQVLVEQRLQVRDERAAAAQVHLEQQRLAFLEREAAVAAHRLIAPLRRQPEVVHGVAGLVHRAEQSRERIDRIEARGHADVAGHALGERMLALIEPAAVERKAKAFSTSSASCRWRTTLNLPLNGTGARSACTSMA